MVLPLNLAITAAEISAIDQMPENIAWMACHFSPCGPGITNIPNFLPAGSMLILNDRMPCQGHSPGLITQQLKDVTDQLCCESVLLDFQRPGSTESEAIVRSLVNTLPCPVAVSEFYADGLDCPVFLSPAPLHVPLKEYLSPWKGREIWLEAALCQEMISITEKGTTFAPQFPTDHLEGGFFDEELCCNYRTRISEKEIDFTLFDTRESLAEKMKKAHSLGISRAVGLYQELGFTFLQQFS